MASFEGADRTTTRTACNGGPSCYVQFGPGDHKGYKGDFLTIRELRDGELRLDGYYRPTWGANELPTPTHELADPLGARRGRDAERATTG